MNTRLRIVTLVLLLGVGCAERPSETQPKQQPVKPDPTMVTGTQPNSAKKPARASKKPVLVSKKSSSKGSAVKTSAGSSSLNWTQPKPPKKQMPFKGRKIALIHTANMIGEIEPCG